MFNEPQDKHSTGAPGVLVVNRREIPAYIVTEWELQELTNVGAEKTFDVSVALALVGVLATVVTWILTVGASDVTQAVLSWAVVGVVLALLVFFGLRAYKSGRRYSDLVERIKAESPKINDTKS